MRLAVVRQRIAGRPEQQRAVVEAAVCALLRVAVEQRHARFVGDRGGLGCGWAVGGFGQRVQGVGADVVAGQEQLGEHQELRAFGGGLRGGLAQGG